MADFHLLLWLEAPLQSWGFDSRYGRRDTLEFPTRSGILGLICAARGAGGPQTEWLAAMSAFGQHVLCYKRPSKSDAVDLSSERMIDFQTVGTGYDEKNSWLSLFIPKTVNGTKPRGNSNGSKLTYRHYLQDVSFAVIIEASEKLGKEIEAALLQPCWDIYLGRKNCVPTDLVYRGMFSSDEKAIQAAQTIASEKGLLQTKEVLDGYFPDKGEALTLHDVPLQFGQEKRYKDRWVTIIPCQ